MRILEAMARPDLSHGSYPDLNKQRYWEITIMRIRPGQDEAFATAAKAYKAMASRGMPNARWRVYGITAGMPGPTYLIFSSVNTFSQFDTMVAEGMGAEKVMTAEERAIFKKFDTEALDQRRDQSLPPRPDHELRVGRNQGRRSGVLVEEVAQPILLSCFGTRSAAGRVPFPSL